MTDFIDALEQQLVTAHGQRPRRLAMPWRGGAVLVAAAVAAAIVVALVLALASPDSHRAASPPAHRSQTTPATSPGGVSLAVLNGTTVTGLGRRAADELAANGYEAPNVVTNDTTNQSRQRSEVFYEPGHRADALGVAGCLHIGYERVAPMDANARALADRADVAVFLGYDRAK